MKLLIVIPSKGTLPTGERLYQDRQVACEATWLKDCPCDYKFLSDADMGLQGNQYDLVHDNIRTMRTKLMVKYAYDHGYDYLFRCDTDTYVWTNRLMACGFEKYDYMGYCLPYPKRLETAANTGLRTAHGGIGFFLSRKAMEPVIETPPFHCRDGHYWGDIWTGEVLWKHGIYCHRDTRFMDGGGHKNHNGNVFAEELPDDHPYISLHPVPALNMYGIYERFPALPAETVPPVNQLWEPASGYKLVDKVCDCVSCQ